MGLFFWMKIKFLDNKGPRWRIVSQLPVGMQILLWFPVNISWNKNFKFASLNLGKFSWQFFFRKMGFQLESVNGLQKKCYTEASRDVSYGTIWSKSSPFNHSWSLTFFLFWSTPPLSGLHKFFVHETSCPRKRFRCTPVHIKE